jgi:hypothetical protein
MHMNALTNGFSVEPRAAEGGYTITDQELGFQLETESVFHPPGRGETEDCSSVSLSFASSQHSHPGHQGPEWNTLAGGTVIATFEVFNEDENFTPTPASGSPQTLYTNRMNTSSADTVADRASATYTHDPYSWRAI